MTKMQAYFEKNIVPYRQRIHHLETENQDLRLENYTTNSVNNSLRQSNAEKDEEIKRLMTLMNMTEEDRVVLLRTQKTALNLSEAFGIMNKFIH